MSFCFNFKNPDNSCESFNELNIPQNVENKNNSETQLIDCNMIDINSVKFEVETDKGKSIKCGVYEIKYITQEGVSNKSDDISLLSQLNSDLVPGKYEGGLKVWECSIDLINFLVEGNHIEPNVSVLELGCGVGLPGLLSYLCGAYVTFQDYNSEVLELITIPNVILNTVNGNQEKSSKYCQFLYGDWGSIQEKYFSDLETKKLYDIIVTSETIYCKSSHNKLLSLLKSALKPNGVIYLASKVHYFGVGGGIADFEKLLKEDKTFSFSTVYKNSGGVERQILKIQFKDVDGGS